MDNAYPLAGGVDLSPPMPLDRALVGAGGLPGAVIERALAERLALAPGERVRLGTQDFALAAILDSYPDDAGQSLALGTVTIVRTADLAGSGLLGPGTMFSAHYRLLLPREPALTRRRRG